MRMKNDPLWIDVTELFRRRARRDPGYVHRLRGQPTTVSRSATYAGRLGVAPQRPQPSSSTSSRSLAPTRRSTWSSTSSTASTPVAPSSPRVTSPSPASARSGPGPAVDAQLSRWWATRGYSFTLDWILRNATAVATGRAPFSTLEDVSASDFEVALKRSKEHIDHLLGLAVERLGLDHDRVLFGATPSRSSRASSAAVNTADSLTGAKPTGPWPGTCTLRCAGATPARSRRTSTRTADRGQRGRRRAAQQFDKAPEGLAGDPPGGLRGRRTGARSYPLLYLLTRAEAGRDLRTGELFGTTAPSLVVQEISRRRTWSRLATAARRSTPLPTLPSSRPIPPRHRRSAARGSPRRVLATRSPGPVDT